ncbi:MAG TPA: M13 family metallopeptidase [Candidatus Paceibacterota bacterium]|nr:M13 family metallopeptidase [Candidatus Paceibacterota bacterium]
MPKHSWGFDTSFIDTSIRPQDDFYHYAIGNWLKSTEIPKDESRWGSFIILRHRTDLQVRKLINELLEKKSLPQGSSEQLIRDLYLSGVDIKRRNELDIAPLESWRKRIQRVRTVEDLKKLIYAFHLEGISGPWGYAVDQDMKDSERYVVYLYQSGLGMPDRDYYVLNGEEQKRVREAYVPHIERLLKLAGYSKGDASAAATTIMRIETRLAKASMTREDARDSEKTYHKHTLPMLKKLAPSFDWQTYFKTIKADVKDVIVMQPDFLKEVDQMMHSVSLEDWKTYLDFHVVNDHAGYLSSRFVKENFAFYGTVLSGTKVMKPLWRRILSVVDGTLGEPLGRIYVERYFPQEAKDKVNAIVDDLVVACEARIKQLEWMSGATKKKALVKLALLQRKLAYPDKWRSYKSLRIEKDDYLGNLNRIHAHEHNRVMRRLTKPVDRTEWFMNPHEVNAYCNFTMNEIVFPAGILQHPFFVYGADDAVNYGGMGVVIGHEITHLFDNQGAKYDAKGNLKNWWLPEDKKQFEARGKVLEKQFDAYDYHGLPVKGKLTLGENIADFAGLTIAFEAYQMQLARTGRKDFDGFTPEQRFFLAYAQTEHEIERPEAAKLRVLTNEHAPSIWRVNGPVVNMPEFYKAWDVKKGDKLYLPPSKQARIW